MIRKVTRTRYKQAVKRSVEVALMVVQAEKSAERGTSKLQKKSWRGTDFRFPTLRDSGSGTSAPVSVSAAWQSGFGYVLGAVSVAVPAGSRYESGKLVPVTAKMVPVTPRTQ